MAEIYCRISTMVRSISADLQVLQRKKVEMYFKPDHLAGEDLGLDDVFSNWMVIIIRMMLPR